MNNPQDEYQVGIYTEYEGKMCWHFVFNPPKDEKDAIRIYKLQIKKYPKENVKIFLRKHIEIEL